MIAQSPANQSIRLALSAGLGYLQGQRHQLPTGNAAMASFTINGEEIIAHRSTNICRCGTYSHIISAIQRATREV